jgi:hypothetical protein
MVCEFREPFCGVVADLFWENPWFAISDRMAKNIVIPFSAFIFLVFPVKHLVLIIRRTGK